MKNKEELKKMFSEAVSGKDLDKLEEMLLSESEETDRLHEDLWKSATDYCSESETTAAYRRFRNRIRPKENRFWKWAAVLTAGAACCLLAIDIWNDTPGQQIAQEEAEWTEYISYQCETKELILPDSTHVWLNAQSRIVYPERFEGKERKIFMDGEAFFEVKKDSLHPFVVQSGQNKVKVTGTKFNLKTYDERFTATLVEGGIDILLCGNEYVLRPGEVLAGNARTGMARMSSISSSKFPRWYAGEINIYNEPLRVIADDLERKFGVEIIIRNPKLAQERFTVSFVNSENLDEILDAMSIVNSMKVVRKDNIIDIL